MTNLTWKQLSDHLFCPQYASFSEDYVPDLYPTPVARAILGRAAYTLHHRGVDPTDPERLRDSLRSGAVFHACRLAMKDIEVVMESYAEEYRRQPFKVIDTATTIDVPVAGNNLQVDVAVTVRLQGDYYFLLPSFVGEPHRASHGPAYWSCDGRLLELFVAGHRKYNTLFGGVIVDLLGTGKTHEFRRLTFPANQNAVNCAIWFYRDLKQIVAGYLDSNRYASKVYRRDACTNHRGYGKKCTFFSMCFGSGDPRETNLQEKNA